MRISDWSSDVCSSDLQTSREGFAADHLGDRTDIDIVGDQNDLVDALAALGKPLIVWPINGRPPSWPNVVTKADALLECWNRGPEGGPATAKALLGDLNPGPPQAGRATGREHVCTYAS